MLLASADPSIQFHKAEVMAQAALLLAAEEADGHRRVEPVIDEAHLLTAAQREELRLPTNQRRDGLGEPLRRRPRRPAHGQPLPAHDAFAGLDDRVATWFSLRPMEWPS